MGGFKSPQCHWLKKSPLQSVCNGSSSFFRQRKASCLWLNSALSNFRRLWSVRCFELMSKYILRLCRRWKPHTILKAGFRIIPRSTQSMLETAMSSFLSNTWFRRLRIEICTPIWGNKIFMLDICVYVNWDLLKVWQGKSLFQKRANVTDLLISLLSSFYFPQWNW